MKQHDELVSSNLEIKNSMVQKVAVQQALGFLLAEKVFSPVDLPLFYKSEINGYAFVYSEKHQYDLNQNYSWADFSQGILKNNQAIQVFKGDYLPESITGVVADEKVLSNESSILIFEMPTEFDNRSKEIFGVKKGELLFDKNTLISPIIISCLMGFGYSEILVRN